MIGGPACGSSPVFPPGARGANEVFLASREIRLRLDKEKEDFYPGSIGPYRSILLTFLTMGNRAVG
jgi:hypothetical protein